MSALVLLYLPFSTNLLSSILNERWVGQRKKKD